jgi:hypothetical protein
VWKLLPPAISRIAFLRRVRDFEASNALAAEIILADPRYEGVMVTWARLVTQRAEIRGERKETSPNLLRRKSA